MNIERKILKKLWRTNFKKKFRFKMIILHNCIFNWRPSESAIIESYYTYSYLHYDIAWIYHYCKLNKYYIHSIHMIYIYIIIYIPGCICQIIKQILCIFSLYFYRFLTLGCLGDKITSFTSRLRENLTSIIRYTSVQSWGQRRYAMITKPFFLIPIYLQHDGANVWYFKYLLFDLTKIIVLNIKGLWDQVIMIK